jgi:geranylgeranyl diphosphate synthase, type II
MTKPGVPNDKTALFPLLPVTTAGTMPAPVLAGYMGECRDLVLDELHQIVPDNRYRPVLYDLMFEYLLRHGKALRPSLCIATCRALGGRLHDVLRTAAVMELFHNASLVHDDVEDESELRRGEPTLHRQYGVPIAVNVGDAMQALCLQPLLDNMQRLGLGKALRILEIIARMARESVEGQAVELDWVRSRQWAASDRAYCLMTYKKTCWYTFIAPMQVSAVIVGASDNQRVALRRFATFMGVAFQIQDDVLNLTADEERYGKEFAGDLWEGKHTLMLLHALRSATARERTAAQHALSRPRNQRTQADVELLQALIHRYGGIERAKALAEQLAGKARRVLDQTTSWLPPSIHREFLVAMTDYAVTRDQ